jgi:outer membrane protein assembly factor BamB
MSIFPSYIQNGSGPNASPNGTGGLADTPWPMFRQNPRHTGQSPYDTSGSNGKLKWNFQTGDIILSSPAIDSDGIIYVGSYDNKLYAISSDGTEIWNFSAGHDIHPSPAIGADGTIYFGCSNYRIYAISPNGSEKWNFEVENSLAASPTIGSDGTIYIGSHDYKLYAINPDGTEKWNFMTGDQVQSSPAIGSDGVIYVGSHDSKLYAINPDGTERWNFTTGYIIHSSPAIGSDGVIYVGCSDNKLYAINPDGTKKWDFLTGLHVISSPAVSSQGTIYVGSSDHKLYAINPDGTEKWNFETGDKVDTCPAIGSDGTIFIGSWDDNLYAINPDGTEKWHFKTGSYIWRSSPVIGSDGTIYIGSTDGKLYAIGTAMQYLPPMAEGGSDQTVNEGDVVQFDGSASYDPEGTIESYEWDFDSTDGLWWDTGAVPDATGPKPIHIYGDDGDFIVTLRVTDNDNLSATDTCNVTVQNVDPTVTIDSITMEVEIGLRVAGRKYNDVGMTLFEDSTPIGYISIERLPGSPDEQMAWIPVSINFSKSYSATITYTPEEPLNVGGNPVWICLKSQNGSVKKIHHTFNVQQSKKRDSEHWNHVEPWEVDLSAYFIGLPFEITSHITDPGSDDETLSYIYGSQIVNVTYLKNPPNPDPYPSPELNPVDLYDISTLIYEGPKTVYLDVIDDDGGTASDSFIL